MLSALENTPGTKSNVFHLLQFGTSATQRANTCVNENKHFAQNFPSQNSDSAAL